MTGIPGRLVDMHVHTTDSPDAELEAAELASRAAGAGLRGLGFVAHVDFHPSDCCTGAFSAGGYDASFGRAAISAQEVMLLKGVEIGEPHLFMGRAEEAMAGRRYDFVTGALHWVGDRLLLDAEGFAGSTPEELVERYILESTEIASTSRIDILAHFGIWRRGLAKAGMPVAPDEAAIWPGLLGRLFEAMIDRGIALELNTAGLRRREAVTYPTPAVLSAYRRLGGRLVTLGSDTHGEPHVFFGLSRGAEVLAAAGFDRAFFFREGEPVSYPLG
ncbi:MAG: PHP domain-containing protein [Candidatus Fermentibacter sp.]|nr:PHP domain-containing protein [Candidatus Fermentibacter sp.]